ncbi:MAG: ABC-F family ATP-binding cassette domain-containing protein [Verrucomicrobiae bacterium]|nr:ABC-F family ATP-binding cassette domain-containing protein [Verrucomicrobiae bacterium]
MLAVEKVSIQFGGRTLFKDLSLTVRAKERLSLAGPNGAGKSTLLKIIAGIETPDSGRISKAKQVTVGYLPQEGVKHEGCSLFAEAEKAFGDALLLQQQLAEVESDLESLDPVADADAYADTLEVFGDLQLRLEHHDIARMKPRIETILSGLGFSHADFDRPTGTFSGGWQMRIALAKLLLQEPSVLLLDEPTNHLDIETVQWLEQWLRGYGGSIILISHDRSLLDNLTNLTFAFESGQVQTYAGNYSFYLKERDARREQLERSFKNQQREIEKAEQLIDRFRAKASKAKMVQSRIKQLDKLERIELESDAAGIGFRFPQPERSGQTVLKLEGIGKNYGDNQVLKNLNFEIERGDRIAIVGVNGAGKSTFSRIIADIESATSGTKKIGHKVKIGYFSQNHADDLDPKKTVLETVEKGVSAEAASMNLRTVLGAFLFRGDDVFKSVSVLSGGERSRLALARMLLQPANFLILDEPTNHLDMQSQEVLQRALDDYTGTYAIVSHNRSFLDPIVTKVLEFIPHQPMRVFLGNVGDFLEKKAEELAAAQKGSTGGIRGGSATASAAAAAGDNPSGASRKEQRKREAQLRQKKAEVMKPLNQRLEKAEASIAALEEEKSALTAKLVDPEFFKAQPEEAKVASERLHQLEAELETVYSAWSTVSEEIETAEAKFEI